MTLSVVLIVACDVHGISGPGELRSISVSPNATLLAGATQQMVAVGYDADGRVMNIAPTWSVAASGGAIAQTGLFTAGNVPGLFSNTVVASVGSIAGRASITVTPGPLASITVVPTPVTLAVASSQRFTAVGRDASGNIVAFTPTWAVVASGGSIDQAGLFTAGGTPGTFTNTVQASYNDIKGFATVTVTAGPVSSITVTPDPASLATGASQQFTAVGRDANGNVIAMTPVWSIVAGGGTINAAGLLVAGGALGTFANTVKATSGTASGTATVTVTLGALATITVTPNPATTVIGGTIQLTAVGKDAAGNVVAITPDWDVVTASNGASITPTGLYTAGTQVGTFPGKVRASSGGIAGYATTIATTGVLTSITVTPNPVFLQTAGVQQFTAVGHDANGADFAITPTWSVVNGGGVINASSGLFTAGLVAGAFGNTVVATSGSVSGTATVNVAATLATIIVSPNPVSVVVSGTQQFSAVGRNAAGNVFAIAPVWSIAAGGGTISPAGLFTAGTVTGTYTNTVRATSGSFSGTATVTVTATPPTLTTITVVPNSVTMLVNGTQQFEAMGWDALGNVFQLAPVWTVVNGGGSIDALTGLFTAGTVVGTFSGTVRASSGTISGTATVIITAVPPLLATITVTPSPDTLSVGGARQFTAVGHDAGGNVIAITPTWSVVAGGGAISSTGFFSAGTVAGTFTNTVVVSSGSISGFVTVVVLPVPQAITFAAPATPASYGSTFVVAPTASSGLPVTVTPSGGCLLSGATVTMTSGTIDCVLTASQAGNGGFTSAPDVVQAVVATTRAASVTPNAAGKAFGAAEPSPLTTGTLVGFLAGDNVVASYGRVAGEAVGSYTISATLAPVGVLGNYSITYNTALFSIGQVAQTITFAAPVTPASYGSTFVIAPTASSGLAVTVTPSGGCTLSGSTVTMTSGTTACVLTASQAGNGSFTAASDVVQTVVAATRAASVTPNAAGKAFGAAEPSPLTTGTLVGFLAGDNVVASYTRVAGEAVGSYAINATLAPVGVLPNYSITYNTALFTIGQVAQTITFAAPPTPAAYGSTFAIAPTASSGLTVTVTPSGGCTLSGATVTMTSGTIDCVLTATQAGNGSFTAASDVVQTVAATTRAASVTPTAAGKAFGAAEPSPLTTGTLVGFLAGDNVTATYSRVAGETAGTYAISATLSPAGVLGNYAITYNTALFTIGQVTQTITFAALSGKTFGDAPFALSATGGGSGNPVTFVAGPAGVCTVSGATVTLTGAGTCSVTASQAGDANYTAAPDVVRTFSVSPAAQAITFGALAGKTYGDAPFTVSATGGASGNAVTFTAGPAGVCTVSGTTVTLTGAGTCTVTASQAGNVNYAAATDVPQSFTVAAAAQAAVTLTVPGSATVGQAGLTAVAAGGSGTGAYSYSSSTTGVCTVGAASGSIAALAAGTCSITATRAADANYLVASSAAGSFPVTTVPQTITFAQPTTPAAFASTFVVAPTATSGLAVTVTPAGGCSIAGSTVTMTSSTTDCVLTASQAGNATYAAAPDVVHTVAATQATQAAVTLTVPASGTVGQAGLTAIAAGGGGTGAYSYASSTTGVCTVNAASGSLTALTVGTCRLTATRAADVNYLVSATSAPQTFTIGFGAAASFAVLGGSGAASACIGASTVNGDVGMSPSAAISGFPAPCAIVGGSLHLGDATAAAAQANVTTVNASFAGMASTSDLSGQDLGGKDLAPGVYDFSASAGLTGTLTLTGSATDVWVFRIGSTLITSGGATVTLVGASAANVYWQVGSSATIGGTNSFQGNIMAAASITLGTGTNLTGRALSKVDVTMDTNVITLP